MLEVYRTLFNGTKYRNILTLSCIFPFLFFLTIKDYNILRFQMMLIHSYGAFIAGLIFFYKKREVEEGGIQFKSNKRWIDSIKYNIKYLDIELTIIITFINQVLLYFFHPAVVLSTSVLLIGFLLLFLVRQLRLPIKSNIIFLICYSAFYLILSFKFVTIYVPKYPYFTLANFNLTIVLTALFAYSLLGISKTQNIYRGTFLLSTATLCLALLGRRMMWPRLNNPFVVAHVSCVVLMSFSYVYWYDGKERYVEITGQRNKIFNIGLLPNLIGALTFLIYILNIDIDGVKYVWALFAVVFIWYFISIVNAIKKIVYPEAAMICEEMTEPELERLNDYALHLKAARFMKKNFFKND